MTYRLTNLSTNVKNNFLVLPQFLFCITLRSISVPHIIGSCDSPDHGRTGTLYSGLYTKLPGTLKVTWTGNPEDCSREILNLSQHAEGWAMSEDRTECIGIEPPDDTGFVGYESVNINHNPPKQFCTFG